MAYRIPLGQYLIRYECHHLISVIQRYNMVIALPVVYKLLKSTVLIKLSVVEALYLRPPPEQVDIFLFVTVNCRTPLYDVIGILP